jgi:DNA transposition AAA+ family ATPase
MENENPTSTTPDSEAAIGPNCTPEFREQIAAFMAANNWTNESLAKQIGKSAHTVYMYLRGRYAGTWREVERDLLDAIERIEARQLPPSGLIKTAVTDRVARGLRRAERTGDIALLHGPAGLGKTVGCIKYAQDNPIAIRITALRGAASPKALEQAIWLRIESRGWKRKGARVRYLINKLRGANRLLIIDNAQRLGIAAIEWLFDFHDETGCPVALVGNSEVLSRVSGRDQLHSRIGLNWLVNIDPGDGSAMDQYLELGLSELPDAAARKSVLSEARKVVAGPGHIRRLRKQVKLAIDIYNDEDFAATCKKKGAPQTWLTAFIGAASQLTAQQEGEWV